MSSNRIADTLQVALDVTADGRLPLPPYPRNNPSLFYNITIFLYSYSTGMNFTIANGTATGGGNQGDIMAQEPSSTVKHVNWMWPDCLVGDGQPRTNDSMRGVYNVRNRSGIRIPRFQAKANLLKPDFDSPKLQTERSGSLHYLRHANLCHELDQRGRRPTELRFAKQPTAQSGAGQHDRSE